MKKKATPLILGIKGYYLTDDEKQIFKIANPFGFILFKRNIQSAEQVLQLTNSLHELCDELRYIFIDEEGGRVSRLTTSGLVPKGTFPCAYSFFELYLKEGLKAAKIAVDENYFAIGKMLKALGINGNFAPVADLLYDDAHSVIGNRSFGSTPEVVVSLCKSALAGLAKAGVDGCIKHIPGHGLATRDSHISLPVIKNDLEFLQTQDFRVFHELSGFAKFAMTAHVLYECLDATTCVTTSKKAISYIKQNMFDGMLITDDVAMGALGPDVVENAKNAFAAGCDIVLLCDSDLNNISKIIELC
jgi:beta-glucosidase